MCLLYTHIDSRQSEDRRDRMTCCTPIVSGLLDVAESESLARLLKALADPTRLRLVSIVAGAEGGEACVCELTEPVGLTQGTVSHHMKVLVDAGILTREQRGKWAYFAIVPDALNSLARVIAADATAATGAPGSR